MNSTSRFGIPSSEVAKNNLIKYGVFTLLIVLFILIPENILLKSDRQVCIFQSLTGKLCPLCGMTHAVYYFLHFHPFKAIMYNPLVVLLPVLLLFEILYDTKPSAQIQKLRFWIRLISLMAFFALFLLRVFESD